MTRLKFIGLIKAGEKIDTRNLSAGSQSKFNSLWRWWNTESRSDTLNFLTETINRSFEIIQLSLSNPQSDKKLCKIMIDDIGKAVFGILNIQETYIKNYNDRIFWCDLQTLIQCIDLKLKNLKETHSDLFINELP
jgi:hypothetical protein